MAMHSDMTRDTGSTATETGRLLYCMRDECANRRECGVAGVEGVGTGVPVVACAVKDDMVTIGMNQVRGYA
jgi:hypothetical protein